MHLPPIAATVKRQIQCHMIAKTSERILIQFPEELEGNNEDLHTKLEKRDVITQREDEKADLADEVETLRLDIEEMQRHRDAESIERSQIHAQIL
jgi:hypothetical protein